LCYKKAIPPFWCDITACTFSKNVTPGERVGLAQTNCPADREFTDGMCYLRPRQGFGCTLTVCHAYLSNL
jgi:hypothetical protein